MSDPLNATPKTANDKQAFASSYRGSAKAAAAPFRKAPLQPFVFFLLVANLMQDLFGVF